MHGPPSISIPFPPFSTKASPPPPPPPPPESYSTAIVNKTSRLFHAHPYAASAAAALSLGLGVSVTAKVLGVGPFAGGRRVGRARFGTRGVIEDGMLKEAIGELHAAFFWFQQLKCNVVLLSPSPMPPILWTLTITLLKAGYVVIVVVPRAEDADALEARLSPLPEKSALRVLIYDPDDVSLPLIILLVQAENLVACHVPAI